MSICLHNVEKVSRTFKAKPGNRIDCLAFASDVTMLSEVNQTKIRIEELTEIGWANYLF